MQIILVASLVQKPAILVQVLQAVVFAELTMFLQTRVQTIIASSVTGALTGCQTLHVPRAILAVRNATTQLCIVQVVP